MKTRVEKAVGETLADRESAIINKYMGRSDASQEDVSLAEREQAILDKYFGQPRPEGDSALAEPEREEYARIAETGLAMAEIIRD